MNVDLQGDGSLVVDARWANAKLKMRVVLGQYKIPCQRTEDGEIMEGV